MVEFISDPEADRRTHRERTGSYYTPVELVDALLDSALQPLIDDALDADDPEQALLGLTVCDPACGAGIFLIRATQRLASALAWHRAGRPVARKFVEEDELDCKHPCRPLDVGGYALDHASARRDIIAKAKLMHGIDLNPIAVELTRLLLAALTVEPGRPNPDLRSRIKMGNALLGTTPALIVQGIPDVAFKPLRGDDKEVAAALRDRNRQARSSQSVPDLFSPPGAESTLATPRAEGGER
jgi:hypothetical protein